MADSGDVEALVTLFLKGRVAVLTGAGCSTASGIPDYRGEGTRRRASNPVQFKAFRDDSTARRRYWARSMVGWPKFHAARPNPAHLALSVLAQQQVCQGLITQNVDGLHQDAGQREVIELHGNLARVGCLSCGAFVERTALQATLERLNPWWHSVSGELAPDGDAHIEVDERFIVPGCTWCGAGVLKPDVVFFGESVPRSRVDAATSIVSVAQSLLVVGSSLAVFSGLRFVRQAHEQGIPVTILTQGETRGDRWATHKIEGRCEDLLPACVERLGVALPSTDTASEEPLPTESHGHQEHAP